MRRTLLKDPGETEAYTFDWNDTVDDSLATAETISTSAWAVAHGDVTLGTATNTTTTTTVPIIGGTKGQVCDVKNTITTSQSRTLVRRLTVRIGLR